MFSNIQQNVALGIPRGNIIIIEDSSHFFKLQAIIIEYIMIYSTDWTV